MSTATLVSTATLARPTNPAARLAREGPEDGTRVHRLAIVGNSLPRLCGIATFTSDLRAAIAALQPGPRVSIVAMSDPGQTYEFPPSVCLSIREDRIEDYRRAAAALNAGGFDAVSLQHEFGIFGGEAGGDVLSLLTPLTMPIVTTLHTVLANPTTAQHDVLSRIIELSSKVVVMAEKGRDLLRSVYRTPPAKVEVIPHGIPDYPFTAPDASKARHGLRGKTVILTFGLLAPGKGVDVMIEAMPEVLRQNPDAVYLVLGATHPNLLRRHGEAYRESLVARVSALGLGDHVIFEDQFVDQTLLLEYISLCDVYVTPYRNEAQLTSGTLAYSFGLGKAIVSTPYWHARELLADGQGVLVPFDDPTGFGREVSALLLDEPRRQAMRLRAYANSRGMIWARSAERHLAVIEEAARHWTARPSAAAPATRLQIPRVLIAPGLPDVRTDHLLSMCDDTGLFQHAVHSVADRRHGYCVDDNARALLLACRLADPDEKPLPDALIGRFASFVQHAWNPDTKRFRNFMSFDRRWLEEQGSEDSHGRTVWALGECARSDSSPHRRRWATGLFRDALSFVEDFSSPRAWAFTLLGLDAYLTGAPSDWRADRLRLLLADRLMALLARFEGSDWVWFEEGLAYDNARLPEALILTGLAVEAPAYLEAGLRTLRWLAGVQTTPTGLFRPVGTESFFDRRQTPRAFDQQPVEAAAAISGYLAAARAEGGEAWPAEADRAFAWFLGGNDLAAMLVDPDTGGCRDGLHPDRANENQGAESVLSYLSGLADMRRWARMGAGSVRNSPSLALRA
jgi:glycosyltransferase involved in cell wall biosynthesis